MQKYMFVQSRHPAHGQHHQLISPEIRFPTHHIRERKVRMLLRPGTAANRAFGKAWNQSAQYKLWNRLGAINQAGAPNSSSASRNPSLNRTGECTTNSPDLSFITVIRCPSRSPAALRGSFRSHRFSATRSRPLISLTLCLFPSNSRATKCHSPAAVSRSLSWRGLPDLSLLHSNEIPREIDRYGIVAARVERPICSADVIRVVERKDQRFTDRREDRSSLAFESRRTERFRSARARHGTVAA